jgi:APA family basic amino acid/polyamine antiporter
VARTNGLGLKSGVGLVVANMIGAGVLVSAGYMVQGMSAGPLLLAWALGLVLALCGAQAYGALAKSITRSGGEYRYLSDLFHPFVGNMAGWGSLLIGFSAPIAIDAVVVGWFSKTLGLGVEPLWVGTILILGLALIHGIQWKTSTLFQNLLVAIKFVLVLGLVVIGLTYGASQWPTWVPPSPPEGKGAWDLILENQFWIAFAFSGWNAVIYASDEFENPSKDVPRAMMLGCALVGIIYLLVNWVFVANLDPQSAAVVFSYGNDSYVTLGHVLVDQLMGGSAASWMSVFVIIAMVSAMSAMMLVGPRVYAEMAQDGCLPRFMKAKDGRPPFAAVVLQAAVALVLLHTHTVLQAIKSSSAVLMLFTALAVAGVWVMRMRGERTSVLTLGAATIYMVLVSWILYTGLSREADEKTLGVFVLIVVLALVSTIWSAIEGLRKQVAAAEAAHHEPSSDEGPSAG